MHSSNLRPVRILKEFPFLGMALSAMPRDMMDRNGVISYENFNRYISLIKEGYNRLLDRMSFEDRPAESSVMMSLGEAGIRIYEFNIHGRNTFFLGREVSAALENTSLDGVRISDIRLPFRAFYMAFEQPPAFDHAELEQCFEGAYVRQSAFGISISISVVPRVHTFGSLADVLPNIVIDLDQSTDMTVAQVLEQVMEKNRDRFSTLEPMEIPTGIIGQAADAGIRLEAANPPAERIIAGRNIAAGAAIRQALAIIANSLCLLSGRQDGLLIEDRWDGASESEQLLLGTGSKTSRQRAKAQLLERGALPVRYVSLELGAPKATGEHGDSTGGTSTVRAHWRRGHWRRQPIGTKRQDIRLIWVRPVLVNPTEGPVAELSVYSISASPPQ